MLGQSKALAKLSKLKSEFQSFVKTKYEHRAKSCLTCETKGACCTDAHFVNVHVTKLKAVAIRQTLGKLSEEKQRGIYRRAKKTVEKYDLKTGVDTFAKTFACPLFEKEVGCLIHSEGKPVPCISHACYVKREDLPPDELQEEAENQIARLNKQTYGKSWSWLALPIWLDLINPFTGKKE